MNIKDSRMIKDRMSIDDLYFGIRQPKISYYRDEEKYELDTYNLFALSGVKDSVARWVTMTPVQRARITDPLMFLFGDVWSRTQFEWMVGPWPYEDGMLVENCEKVDVFKMYVLPNKGLLMDLVSRVTITSAKRYIKREREFYGRRVR